MFQSVIPLLRPKHWIKNTFVLAPLLFSGAFNEASSITNALIATVLFCITSSAGYIFNDLIDYESDKNHPVKSQTRAIAAGLVTKNKAIIVLILMYLIIIASSLWRLDVGIMLIGYLFLNIFYSLYLKRIPVIDIFTISSGFVLRVYTGSIAIHVPLSLWMFVTSFTLALFLASIKRRQELLNHENSGRHVLEHYSLDIVDKFSEISATGSLIFYSLYVMSEQPDMVITIPIVLYGLFRYWFLVNHKNKGESPVETLLSDIHMIATVILWVALCGVIIMRNQ